MESAIEMERHNGVQQEVARLLGGAAAEGRIPDAGFCSNIDTSDLPIGFRVAKLKRPSHSSQIVK